MVLGRRIGFIIALVVVALIVAVAVYVRRNLRQLEDEAVAALPDPVGRD